MKKLANPAPHFLLGINYWPRKKAMYWWKHFSEKEIQTEFKQIKSLNLKLIRIFLVWEDFQPSPHEIYSRSIRNLQTVLEIADAMNLKILVTLFTGHMSGVNWVPCWALSNKKLLPHQYRTFSKNKSRGVQVGYFYKDPELLRAQIKFLRVGVPLIKKYPSLFGWDLGNEPSILLKPRNVADMTYWVQTLARELKELDPDHPITLGIHQGDLSYDTKFHPAQFQRSLDIPSMHGYPNYSTWARYSLDSKALSFLNFLTERMTQKKVLFAEFGLPIAPRKALPALRKISQQFYATDEEGERYFKHALNHLYRVGSLGALAWCFSDYHPSLKKLPPFDQAPHELYFGITKSNGQLKKIARVLRKWGEGIKTIHSPPVLGHFPLEGYFRSPEQNLRKLQKIFLKSFQKK